MIVQDQILSLDIAALEAILILLLLALYVGIAKRKATKSVMTAILMDCQNVRLIVQDLWLDGLVLEEVPPLLLPVYQYAEIQKWFYLNFVMTETQMEPLNVIQIVQEMLLAGLVLEATPYLHQLVSLHAEMASEPGLKSVMTGSQLKTIRNASLTVRGLKLAGLARGQLDQFLLAILYVETAE